MNITGKKFKAIVSMIRLPNLIMLGMTQFLVRYFLILPAYHTEEIITGTMPEHMSNTAFLFLVISSLVLAAGGYIINDVYDRENDEVNKPGKNKIGNLISEKQGRSIFFFLSAAGIIIGFAVAVSMGIPQMGAIHLFTAFSLYIYASFYKRTFLAGNILIALLTALGVIVPGLYEPEFYRNIGLLLIYGIFAFALSMIREIIKDMEDVDGDRSAGANTLPVRKGIKISKGVATFIILITMLFSGIVLYGLFYESPVISFSTLLLSFEVPFIALSYLVITASEKKDFYYASLFSKLIMLAGILTLVPLYFYFMT